MQNFKFYFAFLLLKQMCIFTKQESMNGKKYTQSGGKKLLVLNQKCLSFKP